MNLTFILLLVASLLVQSLAVPNVVVSVLYYTQTNYTKLLAKAIAEGAESVNNTKIYLLPISEVDMATHVLGADALFIGAPVHFGNVAATFLQWIEEDWAPYWQSGGLRGKIGGVFATGGGIAQGVEHVLASLTRTLMTYQVRPVVPDPTGSPYTSYGAFAATRTPPFNETGKLAQAFVDVGRDFGAQVAELAVSEKLQRTKVDRSL